MSPFLYELLGYLASLLVAVSLMMRSVVRLRIINLVGALCFSIYGLLIGSLPVAGMNAFITVINIFELIRLARTRTAFKVIESQPDEPYLRAFLQHYASDLQHYFPSLPKVPVPGQQFYLVLRDAIPVGIVITEPVNRCPELPCDLRIFADYVIPGFRDMRPGQYFYKQYAPQLKASGIQRMCADPGLPEHQRYLSKMGFHPDKLTAGLLCREL